MPSYGYQAIASPAAPFGGIAEGDPRGRNTLRPISAILHVLDDGEGNLGGSGALFTIMMDDLCQRLHVIQSLELPIHLHVGLEELAHLVDFFFHLSRPLSFYLPPLVVLYFDAPGWVSDWSPSRGTLTLGGIEKKMR